MDPSFPYHILLIVVALLFSAFFSGMEIAFLSSNKLKLEIDKKQNPLFKRIADLFTGNPADYITTILIGNNIALVVYSLQMTVLLGMLLKGGNSVLTDTFISTLVIIFAAEFLPKAVVKSNPNFYFRHFSYPVYVFYLLFYPLSRLATGLSGLLLRLFGIRLRRRTNPLTFNKFDLADLVNDSTEDEPDAETDNDIRIFQNALEFSDIRVRDCMVRRVDIEAIDIEASTQELRKLFVETHFSRIPVYEGSIDTVVGYVTNKELFRNPGSIRDMLLKIAYVPETMPAQKLLASFIKSKRSIAVVLDEFGVTAGMITIEDILEEIFGEIEDEYDENDLIEKRISDSEYVLSGRLEVEDLNGKYGLGIPESEEYDTLAGFIIYTHGGFPKTGERIEAGRFRFHILKMSASKIELVKLSLPKPVRRTGD